MLNYSERRGYQSPPKSIRLTSISGEFPELLWYISLLCMIYCALYSQKPNNIITIPSSALDNQYLPTHNIVRKPLQPSEHQNVRISRVLVK